MCYQVLKWHEHITDTLHYSCLNGVRRSPCHFALTITEEHILSTSITSMINTTALSFSNALSQTDRSFQAFFIDLLSNIIILLPYTTHSAWVLKTDSVRVFISHSAYIKWSSTLWKNIKEEILIKLPTPKNVQLLTKLKTKWRCYLCFTLFSAVLLLI